MNVKKKSQKQESSIAQKLGGKPIIASGALWFDKADVKSDTYLVECKYTDSMKYSLTQSTWDKVKKEARKQGLIPLMHIKIIGTNMFVGEYIEVFGDRPSIEDTFELVCCLKGIDSKSFLLKEDIFDEFETAKYFIFTFYLKGTMMWAIPENDFLNNMKEGRNNGRT